jgi:hypothetical protein
MNITPPLRVAVAGGALVLSVLAGFQSVAFPPAPVHKIMGVVRDSIGNPISNGASVVFLSSSGTTLQTFVATRLDSGMNYILEVPMDAGLTSSLYQPTALMPAAPFKLKVKVGNVTYLPMEMKGDFSKLGLPAGQTKVDLTLGVDADGNGLPDDWEKAVAARLGLKYTAGFIRPGDLFPGTGMTYQDVYIAGTYALPPKDGFILTALGTSSDATHLSFTAVKGRVYTIQSANTLGQWSPASFIVNPAATSTTSPSAVESYSAGDTRKLAVDVPTVGDQPAKFFRLTVE